MASKFQNRLVGSCILIALGVILLPGLLDGNKKHYEEQFASIPLVPKAGDEQDIDALPPVSQPLTPPIVDDAEGPDTTESPTVADTSPQPETPPLIANREGATTQPASVKPVEVTPVVPKPPVIERPQAAKPVEVKPVEPKPIVSKPAEKKPVEKKPVEQKPVEQKPTVSKPVVTKEEKAPEGQSYVVQLGALKNANKVDEIVATLRLSGYRVYTVPSKPTTGTLTRIYVGPDASKQKLQSQLSELQRLSGLGGQVKSYETR